MESMSEMDPEQFEALQSMAHKLRMHAIDATNASRSGHPTSCSSVAEILSVLVFRVLKFKIRDPRHALGDRLVLSKGHAAPILYAAFAEAGLFSPTELLNLRKVDSDLEGHPTPRLNFVDVGTGSLGQGLSVACGMAYVGKYFDKSAYRTYCVLGDGECAEGSVWEAINFASHYKLDNLCAIFDINRLGQSDPTMLQHNMDVYQARVQSFGFHAIVVDGHSVSDLCAAFSEACATKDKPTAILAKTLKGKHFLDIEDADGWHGKVLGDKSKPILDHLRGLMKIADPRLSVTEPTASVPSVDLHNIRLSSPPEYEPKKKIATRLAYGVALQKLVAGNRRVIALDADTKNSTFADKVKGAYPENLIECFIAEQNMAGVAIGVACRRRAVSFASTFATFFTRTFDHIRMGAVSNTSANFVGSHCGVSVGVDGPSQMGLEDIALFRTIPGCVVFYPSDAVSTERAVELAANYAGICFIRTTREATPVIYCNDANFRIGKACVVRKAPHDKVLVIAAGITLVEAVKAYETLKNERGIHVRIIDPFTIKPIDAESIIANAGECNSTIITVEDHYYEGGLGEAVLAAVAEYPIRVKLMAVGSVPRSGQPHELLKMFKIDAQSIVETVLKM